MIPTETTPAPTEINGGLAPDDSGIIVVWVTLLIGVVLALGALVVDLGALHDERRQLQNGADAAALAVAEGCAREQCGDYNSIAATYADANARDGKSDVAVCFGPSSWSVGRGLPSCASYPGADPSSLAPRHVMATTSTRNSSGGPTVDFVFAPAVPFFSSNAEGATVDAHTIVGFGPLGQRNNVIAVTLPECNFDQSVIGPNGTYNFPNTDIAIFNDAAKNCGGVGFNFLEPISGTCLSVGIDVRDGLDEGVAGAKSSGFEPSCKAELRRLLNLSIDSGQPALFPILRQAFGSGTNRTYTISGLAAVRLCSFSIRGESNVRNICNPSTICPQNNDDKICGRFVPLSFTDGEFGFGKNFGSVVIKPLG